LCFDFFYFSLELLAFSALVLVFQHSAGEHCLQVSGLSYLVFREIDFLSKHLLAFVENSYLKTDMCKSESSQSHEIRALSADASKPFRKPGAFN